MSYIVSIAGGSGSGKSTFANRLLEVLGDNAEMISHDDYYKHIPGMSDEERYAYNFDVPEALDSYLLAAYLQQLKSGNPVDVPIYDFTTQSRSETYRHVEAKPVILVEGILVQAEEQLREVADLTIYIDVEADIRVLRRLARDVVERGHSIEGCMQMYLGQAKPAHDAYVEPCRETADIVITDAMNDATLQIIAKGIVAAAQV